MSIGFKDYSYDWNISMSLITWIYTVFGYVLEALNVVVSEK